jgi:hypothetical protein
MPLRSPLTRIARPGNASVSTTLDIGVDAANFIESFRHAVSLLGNQMPRLPKVRVVDAD